MPPQQQWPWWLGGRQKQKWATGTGGLQLPLLDPSASSDGDDGSESGSASARAEAQVAWQQRQYSAGLVLLSGGFVLNFADEIVSESTYEIQGNNGLYVAYAIAQTVGLMLMATSTADANLHVKQHRMLAGFVAVVFVVGAVAQAVVPGTPRARAPGGFTKVDMIVEGISIFLPALPFLYLLLCCRFSTILNADSAQHYRFSELLLCGLALNSVGLGVNWILKAHYWYLHDDPQWTAELLTGVADLLVAVATALAYRIRRRQGDSLSVALHYSIFVYLLGYGTAQLFKCVLWLTMLHSKLAIGQWLFGPIHIVPALTALSCRSSAYKWLGKRKLDEASLLDAQEGRRLEPHQHRGNLPEIEDAILNRLALDACVFRTERDDYSLIHLTVMNGHLDALQRLLMLRPGVQVDKPTGKLGRTALFIAAERGLEAAVLMLIEGNRHAQADVNARDLNGATPLIVATSRGHTKIAALLREHGAEEGKRYSFMGLEAADLQGGEGGGDGAGKEEATGRQTTERALLPGDPGYDDDDDDDDEDDGSDYARATESTIASYPSAEQESTCRPSDLDDESSSGVPRQSTAADIDRGSDFDSATTATQSYDVPGDTSDFHTTSSSSSGFDSATVTATDARPSDTQSALVLHEEHDSEDIPWENTNDFDSTIAAT